MGKSRTYSSIASMVVNTEDNNNKENIHPRGEFNEDETNMESTIATTPFKAKNRMAPRPVSRSASATQIRGLQ
jgi:aminopeptidase-like protein